MIAETIVEELAKRFEQAKSAAPQSLLENRWLQLGAAIAIGYAVGRSRAKIQFGPFARSLATAALATLVRSAMQTHGRNHHDIN